MYALFSLILMISTIFVPAKVSTLTFAAIFGILDIADRNIRSKHMSSTISNATKSYTSNLEDR